RGDDSVEATVEVELPRVAVQHLGVPPSRAHARELPHPRERVERIAPQEASRLLDRTALAPVLVTPVRRALRSPREVEVEVRRPARRTSRPRQHDAQDIRMLVVLYEAAEEEQLRRRPRRVPVPDKARDRRLRPRALETGEPGQRIPQLRLEHERVAL